MVKLQVAVLRGGPSREYDASLQSGLAILRAMPEKYQAHDIFISKDGLWHRNGAERSPDRALQHIDVVLNALHGEYGEDGKVQKILNDLRIPYTGSDALSAAIGMNKILTKNSFDTYGIKSPYHVAVKREDNPQEVQKYLFHHFLLPFIIKPATGSSSQGLTLVKNFQDVPDALDRAFQISDTALIEEYVRGREASVGIINDFRGEPFYTLLPIEVSKIDNRDLIPSTFSPELKSELARVARQAHQALNLRHYSTVDMIVTPHRGIYVLEVNTHPKFIPESRWLRSLEAIGSSLAEFIDHIITLALS